MKTLLTVLITAILTASFITARFYTGGGSAGVAWTWGGVELVPAPALFICPGDTNLATDEFTPNPIAPYFPTLLTDC